jgi:hypothetical protein
LSVRNSGACPRKPSLGERRAGCRAGGEERPHNGLILAPSFCRCAELWQKDRNRKQIASRAAKDVATALAGSRLSRNSLI